MVLFAKRKDLAKTGNDIERRYICITFSRKIEKGVKRFIYVTNFTREK